MSSIPSHAPQPQIIAVGGKLLLPRHNIALERYALEVTGVTTPRVGFLATATGDDPAVITRFYETYSQLDCRALHIPLFRRTPRDVRELILSCQLIHVGGGNTRSMLAVWQHWGLDEILREAWMQGTVLFGSSAGMICWFSVGVTDSVDESLTAMSGLGFLGGSACPHFHSEAERRPWYHAMVAQGRIPDGYAADDGVGLHFIGAKLEHAVSAYPGAGAYMIERRISSAIETPLVIEPLGR